MARILSISGSPSAASRTAKVLSQVEDRLAARGHDVERLNVRDLPAAALVGADTADPRIGSALAALERADGVIVATPVYKAAYTGLLKALLDLFPQYALAGKAVLPLVTGGSPAHVLVIDYALRPVLTSMGARHVVQGYYVLDRLIAVSEDGGAQLQAEACAALFEVVDGFNVAVGGGAALTQAS